MKGFDITIKSFHAFLDFTWFNLGSLGFRAICTLARRRAFSMTMALTILLLAPSLAVCNRGSFNIRFFIFSDD